LRNEHQLTGIYWSGCIEGIWPTDVDVEEGRGGGEPHPCGKWVVGYEGGDGGDVGLAGRFADEGERLEQDSVDTDTWKIERDRWRNEHPWKQSLPGETHTQNNVRYSNGIERSSLAGMVGGWPAVCDSCPRSLKYFETTLTDRLNRSAEMIKPHDFALPVVYAVRYLAYAPPPTSPSRWCLAGSGTPSRTEPVLVVR